MANFIEEILGRRNLVRELVAKDLKLRYKRPALGIFWAFLAPLLMVAVLYLVFYTFLKVQTPEAPFVLYLMTAVFSWKFFQDSLILSATSLLDNRNLIREANFPKWLIPFSVVLANLINFIPALCILISASAIFNGPTAFLLLLPAVVALHFFITLGLALAFSIFYLRVRDIKYILEIGLLALFYLTPAFYSISLVKATAAPALFQAYLCNPFTDMLNLYRVATLKGFYFTIKFEIGLISMLFIAIISALAAMLTGIYFYNKNKNSINDYVSY